MFWTSEHIIGGKALDTIRVLCPHWKEWTYSDFSVTIDAKYDKSATRRFFQKFCSHWKKPRFWCPYIMGESIARGDEYGKKRPLQRFSGQALNLTQGTLGSHEFSWLLFDAGKEIYEQRTIGNHARCDGCKTDCRSIAHFQSRGIQPTEQPGFSHFADWRAEAGNEAGLTGMVAEPHQQERVRLWP